MKKEHVLAVPIVGKEYVLAAPFPACKATESMVGWNYKNEKERGHGSKRKTPYGH